MDVYKEWLGIPEDARPPNHYELLRLVQFEDDEEKIRKHYKKLNATVRKYATGQYSKQSQDLLNELAKAMICLTAPKDKRKYDESLGREFDESEDVLTRKALGEVLVDRGIITEDQLRDAENHAEPLGISMRDAVVQLKLASKEQAAEALAVELGLSYLEIDDVFPDEDVLDQVPAGVVRRHRCLPLFRDQDRIVVACLDQPDEELEDEIRLRFDGTAMRAVISPPKQVAAGVKHHYAPGMRNESAGSSGAKSGSGKTKDPKRPTSRVRFNQLSEEERQEKKKLGLIIMMAPVVVGAIMDTLLPHGIKPFVIADNYCFTLLLFPFVALWVKFVYWR